VRLSPGVSTSPLLDGGTQIRHFSESDTGEPVLVAARKF
jgi:hypothetical protein